ncbi:MAG: sigma-70 family RNA polymerase sigma factor [Candidatus Tritonobacter lacicola]|nr:sigma-70 family RNA polymerase sigma factor [Candidatus Tritonobacter lacicola]
MGIRTSTTTDPALVKKAQGGDKDAFVQLYDMYKVRIMNYVYRTIGDYQVAEEVTQETFIKAHRHIRRYRPTGTFSAWLYRIASNLSKNTLRNLHRRGFRRSISTIGEGRDIWEAVENHSTRPDYAAQQKELYSRIQKALGKIRMPHRETLILHDIEGLSYSDVARITGCKEGTVASRLSRGRREFKKLMAVHQIRKTGDEQ